MTMVMQLLSTIATAVLALIIPLYLVLEINSLFLDLAYGAASLILLLDFVKIYLEFRKSEMDSSALNMADPNKEMLFLLVDFIGAIPFILFGTSR